MDKRIAAKYKTQISEIKEVITSDPESVKIMADIIFPDISGCYDAKMGLMCMLANSTDNSLKRKRLHVLLHGVPGTGKSELSNVITSDFGGLKLTCDPKSSALKGDGRRGDGGVKLLHLYSGRPVVIHDIELTKDIDALRDVMEDGMYTLTSGGEHHEYEARCSVVGSSNDVHKISDAILSRFDLVYKFEIPTPAQSMDIVYDILNGGEQKCVDLQFKRLYINMVQEHEPEYAYREEASELYKEFFKKHGGKTGRYIQGIDRIAKALAKLKFSHITPETVELAMKMKLESEKVVTEATKGVK